MSRKILFFAIIFTILMWGGHATGASRFSLGGHIGYQGQIDGSLAPLSRLVVQEPLAKSYDNIRIGISRVRYRSHYGSRGSHSYRRYPGHSLRFKYHRHHYRHGYQRDYYKQKHYGYSYRYKPSFRHDYIDKPYRYHF